MNFVKKLSLFILLFFSYVFPEQDQFKIQLLKSGCCYQETKISYHISDARIGYICAVKLPFSQYALHSLFIIPEFRNQGYGTKLLKYTCDYLQQKGAKKIFIQPGPFDLIQDHYENISDHNERAEKLQKLVNLYKRVGFKFTNKAISKIAWLICKIGNIDEDPKYLMNK